MNESFPSDPNEDMLRAINDIRNTMDYQDFESTEAQPGHAETEVPPGDIIKNDVLARLTNYFSGTVTAPRIIAEDSEEHTALLDIYEVLADEAVRTGDATRIDECTRQLRGLTDNVSDITGRLQYLYAKAALAGSAAAGAILRDGLGSKMFPRVQSDELNEALGVLNNVLGGTPHYLRGAARAAAEAGAPADAFETLHGAVTPTADRLAYLAHYLTADGNVSPEDRAIYEAELVDNFLRQSRLQIMSQYSKIVGAVSDEPLKGVVLQKYLDAYLGMKLPSAREAMDILNAHVAALTTNDPNHQYQLLRLARYMDEAYSTWIGLYPGARAGIALVKGATAQEISEIIRDRNPKLESGDNLLQAAIIAARSQELNNPERLEKDLQIQDDNFSKFAPIFAMRGDAAGARTLLMQITDVGKRIAATDACLQYVQDKTEADSLFSEDVPTAELEMNARIHRAKVANNTEAAKAIANEIADLGTYEESVVNSRPIAVRLGLLNKVLDQLSPEESLSLAKKLHQRVRSRLPVEGSAQTRDPQEMAWQRQLSAALSARLIKAGDATVMREVNGILAGLNGARQNAHQPYDPRQDIDFARLF